MSFDNSLAAPLAEATPRESVSTRLQRVLPALGRSLLALIFVVSGLGKIGAFEATQGYMAAAGMPLTGPLLVAAIAIEVLGGLMLMVGFKARWGAFALIVFLIPATFIFHAFWTLEGGEVRLQMIQFLKNLSIIGGLLVIVAWGPGPLSLDRWRARAR